MNDDNPHYYIRLMEKVKECNLLKDERRTMRERIRAMETPFQAPVRPVQWDGDAGIVFASPQGGSIKEFRVCFWATNEMVRMEGEQRVRLHAHASMINRIVDHLVADGWVNFTENEHPPHGKSFTARIISGRYNNEAPR